MEFNVETFTFLNDREFEPKKWIGVSKAELEDVINSLIASEIGPEDAPELFKVVELYSTVLVALEPASINSWDDTDILTVHADENGLVDVVLGPAIFQKDGGLVLKVGSNICSVTQNGTDCAVGGLSGDIEVIEKDGKDENGAETKYLSVSFDVYLADLEVGFSIPLVLNPENKIGKQKFKQDLKNNVIAQYLKPVPEGGNWVSMNDLDVGEYLLTNLVENEAHPEYGRSWTMTLLGVGDVRSKGKRFEKSLEQKAGIYRKLLSQGKPVTLLISNKTEMSQGIRVNAGFFSREPKQDRIPANIKSLMVSGGGKEQKQLAGVGASQQTIDVKTADYDDIPF